MPALPNIAWSAWNNWSFDSGAMASCVWLWSGPQLAGRFLQGRKGVRNNLGLFLSFLDSNFCFRREQSLSVCWVQSSCPSALPSDAVTLNFTNHQSGSATSTVSGQRIFFRCFAQFSFHRAVPRSSSISPHDILVRFNVPSKRACIIAASSNSSIQQMAA
jgi:hypothetical protein